MAHNRGGEKALLPGQAVAPARDLRFAELLAAATPLDQIATELDMNLDDARRMARSANVLTIVASVNLAATHSQLVPRALRNLDQLLQGFLEICETVEPEETDVPDRKHAPRRKVTRVPVKPETVLAATQTVLKMGGYDKPPESAKANENKDLSEMTPDELRRTVHALEAELSERAAPVSAPDVPDAELIEDETPNDYNPLG